MHRSLQLEMLAIYFGAILLLAALMLGLSALLGERHARHATLQPYESGMLPIGQARLRFPQQFYVIAMLFVVFDLEAVYVYAWAVAARAVGWGGYIEIVVFIAVLAAALAWLWRAGALEWTTRRIGRRVPTQP